MKFFKSLYRSLFDIEWLRAKRDTGLWPAIGFLFVVVTAVTVLRTAPILGFVIPRLANTAEQKLRVDVPDFALIMEEGKLRTEKLAQPYTFTEKADDGIFTFVIDTVSTSTPSAEDLVANKETDVAVVLGREGFNYFDPDSKQLKTETYTDIPNGTLSKDEVLGWVQTFRAKYMIPAMIGLGIFFVAVMFVVRLVVLVLWSLVFLLVAKLKKLNWKFGEMYRVGSYASTLPLLVGSVALWFGWSLPAAAITFMILMYMVVVNPYSATPSAKTEVPKV